MILRLANWAVMGIALFYAAEGFGVLERGKYFPTLPRLEASASDPGAWLGAVQWGVGFMTAKAQERGVELPEFNRAAKASENNAPVRFGAYGQATQPLRRMASYYGG